MLAFPAVKSWCLVHKWTSLICTAFLLLLCITGLPLIFGEEIDQAFSNDVAAAALPESTPDANLDAVVAAAQQRYPNEYIQSFFWDEDVPHTIRLSMARRPSIPFDDWHDLVLDTRTAQVLAEPGRDHGFMWIMLQLHTELFADLPGELFLGAMGLLFVVSVVSGIVVYGPFMRKLDFGTVRRHKTPRVKWLDLHNLLGIVTLVWAFVVGLTGVINTLATPLFNHWRSHEAAALLVPYKGKPAPAQLSSVQDAMTQVRAALPDSVPTSVAFPYSMFGSPHHYLIWTKGREPLTARLFTPVLVDAATGELTAIARLPWYLKALEVSRPLHFGDYGGLPLKILWTLLDLITIIVLASGLYLWLKKRAVPFEQQLIEDAEFDAADAAAKPA